MIGPIMDRLEQLVPDVFKAVHLAEDLDALHRGTAAPDGTVFVVPYRDRAEANTRATGGHLQRVEAQVLTAIVVRCHADSRGAERARLMDTRKAAVEKALAGWQPDDVFAALELVGGEGTAVGENASIYVQTWETSRYLTGTCP